MKPRFSIILRIALAGVLLAAGVQKLEAVEGFAHDLFLFGLVNWDVASRLAAYLPWLEIATALSLAIPRIRNGALLLAATLSVAFTASHAIAWWRDLDFSCGCFGHGGTGVHPSLAITGTLLMFSAAIFLLREPRRG